MPKSIARGKYQQRIYNLLMAGWSVETHPQFKGAAKQYEGKYLTSLAHMVQRMLDAGINVITFPTSVHGKERYVVVNNGIDAGRKW